MCAMESMQAMSGFSPTLDSITYCISAAAHCSPLQRVTNPMPTRAARVSRYVRSKNLFSVFRTTSGLVPVKARRGYPTPTLAMAVIHHVGAGY